MIPSIKGESKADTGIFAAGALAGVFAGQKISEIIPDGMTATIYKNDRLETHITDKFIKCAQKVSENDLFRHVDPHTERNWFRTKHNIIIQNASKAKMHPKSNERYEFQRIYNLGMQFFTNRNEIAKEDIGLAKRGAKAITYGKNLTKTKTCITCAVIFGTAFLAIKKIRDKMQSKKDS